MDRLGWFKDRFRLIDDAEQARREAAANQGPPIASPLAVPVEEASLEDPKAVGDGESVGGGSRPAPASEGDRLRAEPSHGAPLVSDDPDIGKEPTDDPPRDADETDDDSTRERPLESEGEPEDKSRDKPADPGDKPSEPGAAQDHAQGIVGGLIQHEKLEDAIKWAAAGFTALAAVLAFLGYKEGVLDQALRIYPAASVAVLVLLGIGVVGALFARAIDPEARFLLWSLLALLLLMLFSASLFLPDIGDLSRGDPLIPEESGFALSQLYRPFGLLLILAFLALAVVAAALWEERRRWAYAAVAFALMSAVVAAGLLAPRTIDPLTGDAGDFDTTRLAAFGLTFALLAVLLVLTVVAFDRGTTFSTMAGLTILAVAATSLGLYGATKVAVEAKSLRSLPQVVADIENKADASSVVIAVTGSRVRGLRVIVEVRGVRRAGMPRTMEDATDLPAERGIRIWAGLIRPGSLDEIDRSIRVDIRPERWDRVAVYYCLGTEDAGLSCDPNDAVEVATFATPAAAKEIAQITAKLEGTEDGKVKASFSAADVAPGVLTRLELCRQRADKHMSHVVDVSLAPDSQGNVAWETTVPAGQDGDRLMLRHTTCVPGSPCTTEWRTLSTFVNEQLSREPSSAQ